MNPDDIIKAAPALAQGATALAAAIPFTAIAKKMLGPAADELAERWRDRVRLYRYGRQIKCVEKAEKMAKDAGFTPQAVPIKLLFPLLEGASFEEDESLHDMWASLLANASSPDGDKVRPGFIAILRQMSPGEASLLNWAFEKSSKITNERVSLDLDEAIGKVESERDTELSEQDHTLLFTHQADIDALQANQLICRFAVLGPRHELTARGYQFVLACQPPKPKL